MNWEQLRAFAAACTHLGIEPPAAISRGLALVDVIDGHQKVKPRSVLDMTDDEARDYVTAISIRAHDRDGRSTGRGMAPGIDQAKRSLAAEVRAAAIPDLERIVAELRPTFDAHAEPLMHAATVYGFTYSTTSDQVINLADEAASAAWRAVPKAWAALAPVVSLRIAMSALFDVSPRRAEARSSAFPQILRDEHVNYSVCFAANDNWSLDRGYYVEGKAVGHLDWLALAAGGLRLNSPDEVRAKLDDRGIGAIESVDRTMPTDPMAYLYPTA
ncbi:hypothetical protein [Microbacterium aurum]|uniref:hypothetical protein n=1 Tax=Microbacterium aurum TaxID=36805 RepID=UPI0028EC0B29|nr:hypothetical protein [Microbacterium aurum]